MNERIQELLIEAHKQTKGGIYSGHLSEWTEKFAELIIKECYDVVMTGDRYRRDYFADKIKKHFGME
jgi:hypothetical protein